MDDQDQYKVCTKCKIKKPLTKEYFRYRYTLNRYSSQCKECEKEYNKQYKATHKEELKEYQKKYVDDNRDYFNKAHREYYKKIKDEYSKRNRRYYLKNTEQVKEKTAKYRETHKEERKQYLKDNKEHIAKLHNEYLTNRRENEKEYKLLTNLRNLIRVSFKNKGYKKNTKTEKILGCDIKYFIDYLLKTFKDNYGYEWDGVEPVHIDHIIPLATATTEQDIIKLCHYTNLQLLKAKDNLEKHDKLDYDLKN